MIAKTLYIYSITSMFTCSFSLVFFNMSILIKCVMYKHMRVDVVVQMLRLSIRMASGKLYANLRLL
jgi:hypothetical protein